LINIEKKRLDTLDLIQHITVITGIVSIAYLFVLFVVIARKGSPTTTNMPFEGVSIIIAAHNELDNLKVHIDSIFNQSYPRFEVIVVCDRCTDGSVEFLQSIKHKSLIIKEIYTLSETIQSKKRALEEGIQCAQYPWILLTDADCFVDSTEWIQSMMQVKGKQDVCIGLSMYVPKSTFLNQIIQFETLFTAIQYASWAILGKPYMAVGRNLLYAKQLFINNQGFGNQAQHLGGDDDLLIQQIATKQNSTVGISKQTITRSKPAEGFRAWWRQKHRHLHAGKSYPFLVLIGLSIYPIFSLLFYMGCIYCLFTHDIKAIIPFYILRTCIFISIFVRMGRKWDVGIHYLYLLIAEIVYLMYLLCAGFYNLAVPIKKWK
jgi:glycosyltransferase involved in cell wall biosynthesis